MYFDALRKVGCYDYDMNLLNLSMKNILSPMIIALAMGYSINGNATDIVVGSVSCKEWIEDRTGESDSFNKNVDQSWVISFLNGYSAATKIKFLTNVKSEYVFNWMDKYCTSHPQDKINDGALILAHQLIQWMKKTGQNSK